MKRRVFPFAVGVLFGIVLGMLLKFPSVKAQGGTVSWDKDEVVPMVVVKPGIGDFEPSQGNSVGISWDKDEVVPICLVKPNAIGFVPLEGGTILNNWSKDEVKPFVQVVPDAGRFYPRSQR